jgi:hypothetical protein
MGQLVGVLAIVVLLTSLFMWLIKRLGRAELQTRSVLQIVLANALSLTAYTIAMGYSLVPDLTIGEAPHLVAAFQIGVVPQLLCLAGNLAYGRAHKPIADKGPSGRHLAGYVLALGAFALAWYVAREGVTYLRRPTRSQIDAAINQGFVITAAEIKPTLPRVLDAITTLTDVRVEGINMIYMNEIASGYEVEDLKVIENYVRPKVCASEMSKSIVDGASYTYEYWSAGPNRKLFGKFGISSCP